MPAPKRGKSKQPSKKGKQPTAPRPTLENVFEAEDDEQDLARRGHTFDEVDNYEYNVDNIDDEDDEELDSDDAFGESDEERFENFKFAGSKDSVSQKSPVTSIVYFEHSLIGLVYLPEIELQESKWQIGSVG